MASKQDTNNQKKKPYRPNIGLLQPSPRKSTVQAFASPQMQQKKKNNSKQEQYLQNLLKDQSNRFAKRASKVQGMLIPESLNQSLQSVSDNGSFISDVDDNVKQQTLHEEKIAQDIILLPKSLKLIKCLDKPHIVLKNCIYALLSLYCDNENGIPQLKLIDLKGDNLDWEDSKQHIQELYNVLIKQQVNIFDRKQLQKNIQKKNILYALKYVKKSLEVLNSFQSPFKAYCQQIISFVKDFTSSYQQDNIDQKKDKIDTQIQDLMDYIEQFDKKQQQKDIQNLKQSNKNINQNSDSKKSNSTNKRRVSSYKQIFNNKIAEQCCLDQHEKIRANTAQKSHSRVSSQTPQKHQQQHSLSNFVSQVKPKQTQNSQNINFLKKNSVFQNIQLKNADQLSQSSQSSKSSKSDHSKDDSQSQSESEMSDNEQPQRKSIQQIQQENISVLSEQNDEEESITSSKYKKFKQRISEKQKSNSSVQQNANEQDVSQFNSEMAQTKSGGYGIDEADEEETFREQIKENFARSKLINLTCHKNIQQLKSMLHLSRSIIMLFSEIVTEIPEYSEKFNEQINNWDDVRNYIKILSYKLQKLDLVKHFKYEQIKQKNVILAKQEFKLCEKYLPQDYDNIDQRIVNPLIQGVQTLIYLFFQYNQPIKNNEDEDIDPNDLSPIINRKIYCSVEQFYLQASMKLNNAISEKKLQSPYNQHELWKDNPTLKPQLKKKSQPNHNVPTHLNSNRYTYQKMTNLLMTSQTVSSSIRNKNGSGTVSMRSSHISSKIGLNRSESKKSLEKNEKKINNLQLELSPHEEIASELEKTQQTQQLQDSQINEEEKQKKKFSNFNDFNPGIYTQADISNLQSQKEVSYQHNSDSEEDNSMQKSYLETNDIVDLLEQFFREFVKIQKQQYLQNSQEIHEQNMEYDEYIEKVNKQKEFQARINRWQEDHENIIQSFMSSKEHLEMRNKEYETKQEKQIQQCFLLKKLLNERLLNNDSSLEKLQIETKEQEENQNKEINQNKSLKTKEERRATIRTLIISPLRRQK